MQDESILDSIKKLLGIQADYKVFDTDIIIHINSAFFILHQLGAGPSEGFAISDNTAKWGDYGYTVAQNMEALKSYIYLRVRLLFDPPLNSSVIESINRQIAEFEWRLFVQTDTEIPAQG